MSNLAYKERVYVEEHRYDEIIPGERVKRKQKAMNKTVMVVLVYTIAFSAAGILYLSSVINKTKHNIRIETLRKQAAALEIEVHKLKADADTIGTLTRIEDCARNNFGMEVSEDIRYVKIK